MIVYCTGYKISFPFFDQDLIAAPDNEIPLYRRSSSARSIPASTSSACCSRSARSCRSPRRSRSGSPTCSRARSRFRRRPHAREIDRDREEMAKALRRLQAAHDPGRLPPVPAHAPARARGGADQGVRRALSDRAARLREPPASLGYWVGISWRTRSALIEETSPPASVVEQKSATLTTCALGLPFGMSANPVIESVSSSSAESSVE